MADRRGRAGYLSIDAMVGLTVAVLAIGAAFVLASQAVTRTAQVKDRLAAARLAETLYDDLYEGRRPDGVQTGSIGGRGWSYETKAAAGDAQPNLARHALITVERRTLGPLTVEAYLPPVAATQPSS